MAVHVILGLLDFVDHLGDRYDVLVFARWLVVYGWVVIPDILPIFQLLLAFFTVRDVHFQAELSKVAVKDSLGRVRPK